MVGGALVEAEGFHVSQFLGTRILPISYHLLLFVVILIIRDADLCIEIVGACSDAWSILFCLLKDIAIIGRLRV